VREEMTAYIQLHYPGAFPVTRFAGLTERPQPPMEPVREPVPKTRRRAGSAN